jgi:hypothetical protein
MQGVHLKGKNQSECSSERRKGRKVIKVWVTEQVITGETEVLSHWLTPEDWVECVPHFTGWQSILRVLILHVWTVHMDKLAFMARENPQQRHAGDISIYVNYMKETLWTQGIWVGTNSFITTEIFNEYLFSLYLNMLRKKKTQSHSRYIHTLKKTILNS